MGTFVVALALSGAGHDVLVLTLPPEKRIKVGMPSVEVNRRLGERPILGLTYGPGYADCKYGISGLWVLYDPSGLVHSVCPGPQVVFIIPAVAPPPRKASPKVPMDRPSTYYGEVLAVDRRSITLRGSEMGHANDELVIRRFEAAPHLAAGQQDPDYHSSADYRLTDIRVGDKVYMMVRDSGDDDLCASVRILRRPGGVVPPAPWEKPEPWQVPHHEWANAWQAFEEKKIPLTRRFDPNAPPTAEELENERKLNEARAWLRWQWDHTAPPPRAKY